MRPRRRVRRLSPNASIHSHRRVSSRRRRTGVRSRRAIRWAAIAAVVIAIGEAAFIGRLLLYGIRERRPVRAERHGRIPPPRPRRAGERPNAACTPLAATVEEAIPGLRVLPAVAAADAEPPDFDPRRATRPAKCECPCYGCRRSGGFRVSSPIDSMCSMVNECSVRAGGPDHGEGRPPRVGVREQRRSASGPSGGRCQGRTDHLAGMRSRTAR